MIIRSAFLEGTVAPEDRAKFDAHMRDVVVPLIGTYPGIRGVNLRQVVEADEGAPPFYMSFDLLFDTLEDMHAALASDTRASVRRQLGEIMPLLQGRVYHVVFDAA
jgi:uncharacterized protein (TIGR02118 family)